MKLPFNRVLTPLLRPHLSKTRIFCRYPAFAVCVPCTYIYGAMGLIINAHHLKTHFGEVPIKDLDTENTPVLQRSMILHDLKIIAITFGLMQYFCLLIGCMTENPALFLPHLSGQLIVVAMKVLSLFLFLTQLDFKSVGKLVQKLAAIMLMSFNWLQEFCVFRQHLCVCDL